MNPFLLRFLFHQGHKYQQAVGVCCSYTARVSYWPTTLHVFIAFGSLYFVFSKSVSCPSWTRDGLNIVEKVKKCIFSRVSTLYYISQ